MRLRRALASLSLVLALLSFVACGGEQFVASTSDGGGVDAAPEASAPFCPAQTGTDFSCSDFDEKPLPENWNDLLTKAGSIPVTEDDATSVSPPNSLLATSPALAAGAGATQSFVSATSLPLGAVHIAFAVRVDQLSFPNDATGASVVAAIYTQKDYEVLLAFLPSTTGPFAFYLIEISGGPIAAIDAGSTSTGHDLTSLFTQSGDAGPTLGSWQPVRLDMNIDGNEPTATVSVGSRSIAVPVSPPAGTAKGERSFSLGVQATAPAGATKIRFDNVTYGN